MSKAHQAGAEEWQAKFNECLAKEFSDPAYFAVHHLLVISYMVQCDAYDDGINERVRSILKEFNSGADPGEIMKKNRQFFDKSTIRKRQDSGSGTAYAWKTTIMDIRTDTAENYCEDVRKWAAEIENLISAE
jgi:hypothetical protein